MFKGTFTALITPFNASGSVDYGCLKVIIEHQIEHGVDGVIPVGTTGESPTLTVEEHLKVIETAVAVASKKIKVIAGTGANATDEAIELTREAKALGADGTLQATPYYNKPNQEGLFRHFSAIADLGLPVMLYNVPGRTGREIAIETIVRLATHPSIVSVKEAGGDANRVSLIRAACSIDVLSGDDALTLPMLSVGAVGVVSVASNLIPREVSNMTRFARNGDFVEALDIHDRCFPLFRDLFIDTNPVPVKYAMARLGRCAEVYRLPLCEMSDKNKAIVDATLKAVGLL